MTDCIKHDEAPSRKRAAVAERNAVIVELYNRNVPIKDICAATGLTYGSLKVIASKLGCTKQGKERFDYRRGFSVPDHLQSDYDALVRKGHYRAHEAASMLGLSSLEVSA